MGGIVFTWMSSGIVNSFDYDFAYDPSRSLERTVNIWDDYAGYGTIGVRTVAGLFPNTIFYFVGQQMGIGLDLLQRALFFAIIAGSGLSIYCLFKTLDKEDRYGRGALPVAVLYMFNPIASTFIWNQFASSYYSYAFLPLVLALVIHSIRSEKGLIPLCLTGIAWTALVTPSYLNPANAVVDWTVVLAFAAYEHRRCGKDLNQLLKFTVLLMIIWALLNSFWIIPESQYLAQEFSKSDVSDIGITSKELLASNCVPFYKGMLQTGYWALYGEYNGDHWYSWSGLASSPLFIGACTLIAVAALSSAFSNHRKGYPIFLLAGSLSCLLIINGIYPPFGSIFQGVFDIFPQLYTFRSTYQRFGPVLALCYTLMFGYAFSTIMPRTLRWRSIKRSGREVIKVIMTIAIVGSLLVITVPYLNGEVVLKGGDTIPSAWTEIPDSYLQANDWLNEQPSDFYILPMPYCKLMYATYDWEHGYWGWEPSMWIFDQKVISREYDSVNRMLINLTEGLLSTPDYDVGKMFSLLNIKYIMLHEDTNWDFVSNHSWWVRSDLSFDDYVVSLEDSGFILEKSFDGLLFYLNPSWSSGEHRLLNNAITVVGGIQEIKAVTLNDWFDPNTTTIICVSDVDEYDPSLPNNYLYQNGSVIDLPNSTGASVIDVVSEGQEHRSLDISGNGRYLVMSERYDPGWTLTVDRVAQKEHIVVNGFMNAWVVDINDTRPLDAELDFGPQILYYYGAAVSIAAVMAIISFILITKLRHRRIDDASNE